MAAMPFVLRAINISVQIRRLRPRCSKLYGAENQCPGKSLLRRYVCAINGNEMHPREYGFDESVLHIRV